MDEFVEDMWKDGRGRSVAEIGRNSERKFASEAQVLRRELNEHDVDESGYLPAAEPAAEAEEEPGWPRRPNAEAADEEAADPAPVPVTLPRRPLKLGN